MSVTLTSREFNQKTNVAKKAAERGPVIITERGRPAHVLMTYAAFRKLTGANRTLEEMLYMPGLADVDLELPLRQDFGRPADFS